MDEIVDNRVAVLGLGEAGSAIAADLAAEGVEVAGWDPLPRQVDGVRDATSAREAVAGASAVLALTTAAAAVDAAREVAPALAPGCVYADLNTGPPALKEQVAATLDGTGARFADVALMAPVPGRGLRTPCLVSGDGAQALADLLRPLAAPIEVVGTEPGQAAARKLLRSVFMKGMAAAAIEALAAARADGCEPWLHGEIAGVLDGADAALLERLLEGSRRHAERRVHEMRAAGAMLESLGVEPRVSRAATGWLEELRVA